MRFYISGPITEIDDYKEKFAAAEEKLKSEFKDAEVINPTMINLPATCSHDDYMSIDLRLLEMCDAIYMLRGWRQSTGACIEYGYAKANDHIIIQEELINECK